MRATKQTNKKNFIKHMRDKAHLGPNQKGDRQSKNKSRKTLINSPQLLYITYQSINQVNHSRTCKYYPPYQVQHTHVWRHFVSSFNHTPRCNIHRHLLASSSLHLISPHHDISFPHLHNFLLHLSSGVSISISIYFFYTSIICLHRMHFQLFCLIVCRFCSHDRRRSEQGSI